MRVLGGAWAGRDLVSPSGRVRPTAEAVRQAVVPLADRRLRDAGVAGGLEGARVADLFAGTGAVGIELLSRGAAHCTFVEHDPSALHALKANVAALRLGRERASVRVRDAIPLVEAMEKGDGAPGPGSARWDLAYADPPWGSRKLHRVLDSWLRGPWARVLLLEHAADQPFPKLPRALRETAMERRVGDAVLTCLRVPRAMAGLLVLLGGVGLAACDGSPRLEAPTPERLAEATDPEGLPTSLLQAPVVYDLRPAAEAMEDAVPRSFGDLEERLRHPDNDRVHVAFEAERGPFRWELVGDTARLTTTLSYRGRGWYDAPLAPEVSASCGTGDDEPRPRARVTLVSPLTVDAEWRLRSRVQVERIERASDAPEDQCTVTVFGIDVTERVLSAAAGYLNENASRIDAEVARVNLRDHLDGVWERLLEPIELTDDVWLEVAPSGVSLGEVQGEGDQVRISLALAANPRLVLGPPPPWEVTPMPPLGSGVEVEGLRILLDARGRYAEAGDRLTSELADQEFEWNDRTFRVVDTTLEGIGGGKVALGVRFEGSARGRVFLVGTPALDLDRNEIHVPDLDFDVESLNLLMRSAAWIARGNLVRELRQRARLPVSDVMDFATEKLGEGLNRELSDQVRLEGEVLSAQLLDVRATADGLHVRARAEARAIVVVTPPEGS
jgi:16S rRNA (guanine966-N2)-methyltransferase